VNMNWNTLFLGESREMKKSSSFCLFVPIISMVSTIDPNGTKEEYSHLHKVPCCFGGRTWGLSNKSRSSYFFGGETQKKGKINASRRFFQSYQRSGNYL